LRERWTCFGSKVTGGLHSRTSNRVLACLVHYREKVVGSRRRLVDEAATAREGIEKFFTEIMNPKIQKNFFRGCLNTNTATEVTILDKRIQGFVREGLCLWKNYWKRVVKRGFKDGSIPSHRSVDEIASLLIILTQGTNIVMKATQDRKLAQQAVKLGLQSIFKN